MECLWGEFTLRNLLLMPVMLRFARASSGLPPGWLSPAGRLHSLCCSPWGLHLLCALLPYMSWPKKEVSGKHIFFFAMSVPVTSAETLKASPEISSAAVHFASLSLNTPHSRLTLSLLLGLD